MNLKRSLGTAFLGLIALGLVLALVANFATNYTPISQAAGINTATPSNCNGDVKIHNEPGEPNPIVKDEPKVCLFHLHGFNFDPASIVTWRIETQPGNTVVLSGEAVISGNGTLATGPLSLPNGQYKLYWHQNGCPGGDKHKVFKVECVLPTNTHTPTNTPVDTPEPTATNLPGVTPTSTGIPENTPTPTPTRTVPRGDKSHASVFFQGSWGSYAVFSVGGTPQDPLYFNWDAQFGQQAILGIFWNQVPWVIRVQVYFPENLDRNRWKVILWTGTGPNDYIYQDWDEFTLDPGGFHFSDFQLVDMYFWEK